MTEVKSQGKFSKVHNLIFNYD